MISICVVYMVACFYANFFATFLATFLSPAFFCVFLSMMYKSCAILSMQYKSLLHVFGGWGWV